MPTPQTESAPTTPTLIDVAYADLKPTARNPRKTVDPDTIKLLAKSIGATGIHQNLVVRPAKARGKYEIIAGHRRYEAVGALVKSKKWDKAAKTIPVKVVDVDDAQMLVIAIVENLQREDINPLEEAEAFAALIKLDHEAWTTATIAAKIGRTRRHVQLRLALVDKLSNKVKTALREGKISLAQARALTAGPKPRQDKLLKTVLDGDTWQSAPDHIRRRVSDGLIEFDKAIFDPALYTGRIHENEAGKRFFIDSEQFKKLQKAEVPRLIERLGKEWAWVQQTNWFYKGHWQTTDDPKLAGAVVHFDKWSGRVNVHTGLVAEEDETDEQTPEEAEWEARQKEREEQTDAVQKFSDALTEKIAGADATVALKIMAYAVLHESSFELSGHRLVSAGAHIKRWCKDVGVAWSRKKSVAPHDFDADLWERLDALTADQLAGFVRAGVADTFYVYVHNPHVSARTAAMAESFGLELPAHMTVDAPEAEDGEDDDVAEAAE